MRSFTLEDQSRFASVSGDWNPLHVDPLIARRSQFGKPIVHGMHLVLWALDQILANEQPLSLKRISCVLRNPVAIGDAVDCQLVDRVDTKLRVAIHGRDICAHIKLELAPQRVSGATINRQPDRKECREITAEQISHTKGVLPLEIDQSSVAVLFPVLIRILPLDQIAALLATTRLVGMECPGLHSIYSEFALDFETPDLATTPALSWEVTEYDERFRRTGLRISAPGMYGSLTAMLRPGPQMQPSADEVRKRLSNVDVFKSRRALIIGGSRGLGELCAKILAAGGADVRLTYHRGAEDAAAVAKDIQESGGLAEILTYDVLDPLQVDLQSRLGQGWSPTHVYYFSTPPILPGKRNQFSADLFQSFCKYYVEGFCACWAALRRLTSQKLTLFYPSTVWVDDINPMMPEYAASKAAGENICKYLSLIDKEVDIKMVRLPRLPSDQTLSLMGDELEDAFDVLVPLL